MTELNTYALVFSKIEREMRNQEMKPSELYQKAGLKKYNTFEDIKYGKGNFSTVIKLCRALGINQLEL